MRQPAPSSSPASYARAPPAGLIRRRLCDSTCQRWPANKIFFHRLLSSADRGQRSPIVQFPGSSRPGSEESCSASRLTRPSEPRARGSPPPDPADAKGDDATPPCTGLVPTRPRPSELEFQVGHHFAIWLTRSRSHLHKRCSYRIEEFQPRKNR